MSLLVKRNGASFPVLVNELLDYYNDLDVFDPPFRTLSANIPSVNIKETDREFSIEVAAPGREKKDFQIALESNMLTISSEKEEEKKEEKEDFKRREFSFTSFSRSFTLPDNVLPDKIEAKYENGILHLALPKKEMTVSKPGKEIKVS